MKKNYLLSPGPTPVPERVLLAMAKPVIHHRTPQFSSLFRGCLEKLKPIFGTKNDVIILSSSGTGAMEAAVCNCFSKGEKVLVLNSGKFGERWGQISESFDINVTWINIKWGDAASPDEVKKALDADPDIKGVLMQATESSTTVKHPVKEIAAITKNRDVMLVVDGITGVGVFEMAMDDWGIDVLVGGSQKAFMMPPGIAFIALSERAWEKVDKAKNSRFYFNLKKEKKNLGNDTTSYTAPVSLIYGLDEALNMMEEESLPKLYARQARTSKAARAGCAALNLKPVTQSPSEAMTGVFLPSEIDGGKFVKTLRDNFGVTFAGGQDQWKGKVIRIAQLGYIGDFDIIIAMSAIEMALDKFGVSVKLGAGVGAAQAVLRDGFEV